LADNGSYSCDPMSTTRTHWLLIATAVLGLTHAQRGSAQDQGTGPVSSGSFAEFLRAVTADTAIVPLTSFSQISALWPCAFADEFEQQRCEESRPTRLRELQRQTFVGITAGQLGTYDFQHQRFEVNVLRAAAMGDAPEGFLPLVMRSLAGQEREWAAVRDGNLLDLPAALRLTRLHIPFSNSQEAEAWRNEHQAEPGTPVVVPVLVIFRLGRTWTYRAPPSLLEQHLRREFRRAFGPLPAAVGAELRGVDLRPLGYVAVVPGQRILSGHLSAAGAAPTRQLDASVRAHMERSAALPLPEGAPDEPSAIPPADVQTDPAELPDLPDAPSRSAVSSALGGRAAAVRACANGMQGIATVVVSFSADGRVASAAVEEGPFAGSQCIVDVVRGARVPPFRLAPFNARFPYRL
jgi:hypothetical protein